MIQEIPGAYNPLLVALSFLVSVLGSYTALLLARQSLSNRSLRERAFWITSAATAMGAGAIWSMHFIGMVAFDLDQPVGYALWPTLLSLVLAIVTTGVGFFIGSRHHDRVRAVGGGVIMGFGVSAMHYMGMAAMRGPFVMAYDEALVALSVLIGIVAASVALWSAFNTRPGWPTALSAMVMGVAVCGLHYTGMLAASFYPNQVQASPSVIMEPRVLAFSVFLLTVLVLATLIALSGVAESVSEWWSTRELHIPWWAVPLTAVLALATAGLVAHTRLGATMKERVSDEISTVLRANVTALELWLEAQHAAATQAASDDEIANLVQSLTIVGATDPTPRVGLLGAPEMQLLRAKLDAFSERFGYAGWVAVSQAGLTLASNTDDIVGLTIFARRPGFARVLDGETIVSAPVRAEASLPEESAVSPGQPTMYVAAPLRDATGNVFAGLAFRILPETDFTRVLAVGRLGATGETYAFNAEGFMVSESRFEDQLKTIGLLPNDSSSTSILRVAVRDPGGNLLRGFAPSAPREAQPLTVMAASAIAGSDGINVDGYRDYRGVPVVGAWTWLPDLDIGVATEVDQREAFAALFKVRRGLWALFGLLIVSGLAIGIYSRVVAALDRRIQRAERLGQYRLERKIGEGGMGKVYLARHAMLRRPTAIKLIHAGPGNAHLLARFEREVQVTSRLTHPNTISIYDYGRTSKGIFYYAMEYLEGITLQQLVTESGAITEGRVVHLLKQVCSSLSEAHMQGLIHRDIKPANIIVGERGGVYDFVKVLDFGLVREVEQSESVAITNVKSITGTPLYLSPEALQTPDRIDERSDVYAIGAVAFYMVTGTPVFDGHTIFEVCNKHLSLAPDSPSDRSGRPIANDLERLILRCLEKNRDRRPSSAAVLHDELTRCELTDDWTQTHARAWWQARAVKVAGPTRAHVDLQNREIGADNTASEPPTIEVDIDRRSR